VIHIQTQLHEYNYHQNTNIASNYTTGQTNIQALLIELTQMLPTGTDEMLTSWQLHSPLKFISTIILVITV
jgi:hypothetical protein